MYETLAGAAIVGLATYYVVATLIEGGGWVTLANLLTKDKHESLLDVQLTVSAQLGDKAGYMIGCAYCMSFWVALFWSLLLVPHLPSLASLLGMWVAGAGVAVWLLQPGGRDAAPPEHDPLSAAELSEADCRVVEELMQKARKAREAADAPAPAQPGDEKAGPAT